MIRCPGCQGVCLPSQAFCSGCGTALDAAAAIEGDPYLGTILEDRYRLEGILGEGGMGAVYRAEVLGVGTWVAVKLLHDRLVGDPTMLKRFEREARVASRLKHPNSIHILDFGHTPGGTSYLVMEYLEGQSLEELLANEDLGLAQAVDILRQMLAVLEEAHALSIVHRDLKPANIMLVPGDGAADHVKVLDFGIARLRRSSEDRVTQTGMIFGTPEYMSPEMAQGLEQDARADLYAAGVIFYEMITGRRPFEGSSAAEIMNAQINQPPMPPSRCSPERAIPDSLDAMVLWALAKEPEKRFPSAYEFRRVLDAWATVSLPKAGEELPRRCATCVTAVPPDATVCPDCGNLLDSGSHGLSNSPTKQALAVAATADATDRDAPILGEQVSAWTSALPGGASRQPPPAEAFSLPAPDEIALMGRAVLLEELEQAVGEEGHRWLRLVGPPGVGRRRLGRALLGRLSSEGRRGVIVRPDSSDVPQPLGAVQRATTQLLDLPCEPMSVEDLVGTLAPSGFSASHQQGLADIFQLGQPDALSDEARRLRRAEAWRELVFAEARRRPVAFFLEDFERLDASSRELALALATEDSDAPLAMVISHSADLVTLWPAEVTRLAVPGLNAPEMERLAYQLAGGELGFDQAPLLAARAGGNPLLLYQLVALHLANPDLALPDTLAEAVVTRVSHLPTVPRVVLQMASVVGDLVDEELLGRVAADAELVEQAIPALLARRWLIREPGGLAFTHPQVRRVIYATCPAGVRVESHARTAVALRDAEARPLLRAHHLWQSKAPAHEQVPQQIAAGEFALALLDEEAAVTAFRRALRLSPGPEGGGGAGPGRARWVRIVSGLATALHRSGESDEARLLIETARDRARSASWRTEAARLRRLVWM